MSHFMIHIHSVVCLLKLMRKTAFAHKLPLLVLGAYFNLPEEKVTVNYSASFKQKLTVVIKHSGGRLAVGDFKRHTTTLAITYLGPTFIIIAEIRLMRHKRTFLSSAGIKKMSMQLVSRQYPHYSIWAHMQN